MHRPEDEHSPRPVTFYEAGKFIAWLSNTEKVAYSLPTLEQLQAAQLNSLVVMMGKEWTSERWIYDPINKKVNKNPKPGDMAAFRVLRAD